MKGWRGVVSGVRCCLRWGLCVYWRLGKWINLGEREVIGGRRRRSIKKLEIGVFLFGMIYFLVFV